MLLFHPSIVRVPGSDKYRARVIIRASHGAEQVRTFKTIYPSREMARQAAREHSASAVAAMRFDLPGFKCRVA